MIFVPNWNYFLISAFSFILPAILFLTEAFPPVSTVIFDYSIGTRISYYDSLFHPEAQFDSSEIDYQFRE